MLKATKITKGYVGKDGKFHCAENPAKKKKTTTKKKVVKRVAKEKNPTTLTEKWKNVKARMVNGKVQLIVPAEGGVIKAKAKNGIKRAKPSVKKVAKKSTTTTKRAVKKVTKKRTTKR